MRRYFRRLEELRTAFNRELYLGLHDFEAHLAAYPPGSFYLRHRDRLRRDELRTVSVLLYLNPRWQEEEGGALRLHGVGAGGFLDVPPRAGTLATFLSGEIEHEVRLTHRLRLSLTAWFRRRP
jgi:SM-20-related protein